MNANQRKKLFEMARKNTKYNAAGQAVISKDDEWVEETEWDSYLKEEDSIKKRPPVSMI